MSAPNERTDDVGGSLASTIAAVNTALIVEGRLDEIARFFTPDYVAHVTGRDLAGHAGIRSVIGLYRSAFADLQVDVEVLIEGPDRVAWQRTLRGMHDGAFKGFPATGREIVWREMVTSRLTDGRIAEEWVVTDLAEQLLLARKSAQAR
jgi:steroid delta-isomerase-like uncharacterized protein